MPTTKKPVKKAPAKAKKAPKAVKETVKKDGSFAIIETGGKQYRVSEGDTLKIEKLKAVKEGDSVTFDKVLLVDNGADTVDIGTPFISGAKVVASVVEIGRNKKVIVIKYKQKSRYFKKNGHRQPFVKVKIEKIG